MLRLTAVALLLAGCAVNRTDAVHMTLQSGKSPDAVSECIHSAWMGNPAGMPAVRYARGEGYSVTLHSGDGIWLMADTVPSGAGSEVVVRRAWWNEKLAEQVRGCV